MACTCELNPSYQELNNEFLAHISYYHGDDLIKTQVAKIAPVLINDTDTQFADSLVTELPEIQYSNINAWRSDFIFDDKIAANNVFGRHFSSDGTMLYNIRAHLNESGVPQFTFDSPFQEGEWLVQGNTIIMTRYISNRKIERTWEALSTDEDGKTLVFEWETQTIDRDDDGVYEDETIRILPRLNTVEKEDLSRWDEIWLNTLPLL